MSIVVLHRQNLLLCQEQEDFFWQDVQNTRTCRTA